MKKNITINLCSRLYQIDEDAYELLNHYTETLRNYFLKQEGGKEIAEDIEERIAELFDDLKAQGIEAITIEHVQTIIQQIGQLEEITGENTGDTAQAEDSTNANTKTESTKKPQNSKKFYRDSQNKVLAGVLAGCAQYFGGSTTGWRSGFVLISLLWGGINICSFTFHFFLILFVPALFMPIIAYLLAAMFTPETRTPEDRLMMKGKEVNPQNLSTEVQNINLMKEEKKGPSFWSIFLGVLCIGLSTALAIGFLIALGFFVAFLAAPDFMADNWWNISEKEVTAKISIPVIFCGIMLLTSIGIMLYCCIHAVVSAFGKKASLSTKQRVTWLVLWILSLAGFIGSWANAVQVYNQTNTQMSEEKFQEWVKTHTHNGFIYYDEDWDFIQKNGWELVEATNTDRYTSKGEYMTGDPDVRYLDACNWDVPVIYEATKHENVEPGIYRLSAAVRAEAAGENANLCEKYIFVSGQDSIMGGMYKDNLLSCLAKIPHQGNMTGNIWEILGMEAGFYKSNDPNYLNDPVLHELVNRLSESDKQKILKANKGRGYGWSYVYIDSIVVSAPTTLIYGIQVKDEETVPAPGWFSATDFKLEKIGDLPQKESPKKK